MIVFIYLFSILKNINNILNKKIICAKIALWIFLVLLLIGGIFLYLYEHTENSNLLNLGFIVFKITAFYLLLLIPYSIDKIKKSIKKDSVKYYLLFVLYYVIILWGFVYITTMGNKDLVIFFVNNMINIIVTLYAILTVIWFAYHIIHSDSIQKLKKILQLSICIVTFLQLFVMNKNSNFEYCISVFILTYVFIQFLLEDKPKKEVSCEN